MPLRLLRPVRWILSPLRLAIKIILGLLLVLLAYFGVTLAQVWLTSRHYDPKAAQAIVVMGAAQYNGNPSPDLAARLHQALELYQQGFAKVVVVTGNKEPRDVFTEAEAGQRYLVAQGVPVSAVLEAGGDDSYQNLVDAQAVLRPLGDRTVLMVTDPFHEDRSMAIASEVGLSPSPTPTQTSPISGWAAVPYFLKEALGVGLGRIVGYGHLNALHADL